MQGLSAEFGKVCRRRPRPVAAYCTRYPQNFSRTPCMGDRLGYWGATGTLQRFDLVTDWMDLDRCAVLVKVDSEVTRETGCKPTTTATGKVTSKARMAFFKKGGKWSPQACSVAKRDSCRCRCSVSAVHTVARACLAPTTFIFITNHHTSSISLWPQYWSDYNSHRSPLPLKEGYFRHRMAARSRLLSSWISRQGICYPFSPWYFWVNDCGISPQRTGVQNEGLEGVVVNVEAVPLQTSLRSLFHDTLGKQTVQKRASTDTASS
ncbi:hypothetical protein EDB83DRAFT_1258033 [Lactarius deliciosus]|nr:hypothetical protein EDB83DRAFT_1258033 [Lactarius deliciosus]